MFVLLSDEDLILETFWWKALENDFTNLLVFGPVFVLSLKLFLTLLLNEFIF